MKYEQIRANVIVVHDGCWLWIGAVNDSGYGVVRDETGKLWKVHRLYYTLSVGPIPEGDEIEHICHTRDLRCEGGIGCRHRLCIRPDHLTPMSHADNVAEIAKKRLARIRERFS